MATNPTFNCGEFLPGEGPLGGPDYQVTVPTDGPVDSGGPSFAPPPVSVGEEKDCRCVLQCPPIQVIGTPYQVPCTDPVQLPGRCFQQRITYTFAQECGEFPLGGIKQCADVNTYCSTQPPPHPGAKLINSKVTGQQFLGLPCPDINDDCVGACNRIVVGCVWEWFEPFDPGDGGGGDPLDPEEYKFDCIDEPSTPYPCNENGKLVSGGRCTCRQQKKKCGQKAGGPFNTLAACKNNCTDGPVVINCPYDCVESSSDPFQCDINKMPTPGGPCLCITTTRDCVFGNLDSPYKSKAACLSNCSPQGTTTDFVEDCTGPPDPPKCGWFLKETTLQGPFFNGSIFPWHAPNHPEEGKTTYSWVQYCLPLIDENGQANQHVTTAGCDNPPNLEPWCVPGDPVLSEINHLISLVPGDWVVDSKKGGVGNNGIAGGSCNCGTPPEYELGVEGLPPSFHSLPDEILSNDYSVIQVVAKKVVDPPPTGGNGTGSEGLPPPPNNDIGGGLLPPTIPSIDPQIIINQKRNNASFTVDGLSSRTSYAVTNPQGPFDDDIGLLVDDNTPRPTNFVRNTLSSPRNLLSPRISDGLQYVLKNINLFRNWSKIPGSEINQENVLQSLDSRLLVSLKKLKKIDGNVLANNEIYEIFRTRIFEGTLLDRDNGVDPVELLKLSEETQANKTVRVVKSSNPVRNQLAALALLEAFGIPADPTKLKGSSRNTVMNFNILGPDIDANIPVIIDGEEKPLYITDAGTFSPYSTLTMQDGYYIPIEGGKRLFCKTEIDHALINNEKERQKAIHLVGGKGERELTVSSPYTNRVELDYSLNLNGADPRPDVIVGKIIPTTIVTEATQKPLLYETTASYEVVDLRTSDDLKAVNDYIKHKYYYLTLFVSYDDVLLDYVEDQKTFKVKQEDVIYMDSKKNKNLPILVRHIPFYVLIFPTNRLRYLPTGVKSVITTLDKDKNIIERRLKTVPTLDPLFQGGPIFVREELGWPEGETLDVYGKRNVQNKRMVFDSTESRLKEGYKIDGRITDGTYAVRNKKVFRFLYDIVINTLEKNYILGKTSGGLSLYWFDILSRLTLTEFNRFAFLSNAQFIIKRLRDGFFNGIKIISPIKFAGTEQATKTHIVKRKTVAQGADLIDYFPQLKATLGGKQIKIDTDGVTLEGAGLTEKQEENAREGRTRTS